MPSYRLVLTVGAMLENIPAEQVLPRAADALRRWVNVESFDLRITRNRPQLVLRYTASDKTEASNASAHAVNEISSFIEVVATQTLQRVHGRWEYL